MKSKLLLLLTFLLSAGVIYAAGGSKNGGGELLRKSSGPSYPQPFVVVGDNPVNSPAISTGYYAVDSEEPISSFWRPDGGTTLDTTEEPGLWYRVYSGAHQFPTNYFDVNKSEGKRFFRNPSVSSDSVDNVFAGPIPLNFPFIFNGVRYDSFYVSSNGIIALSNRRYYYDADGNRTVPDGATSAYDRNSDDFGVRAKKDGTGAVNANATGLDDPTPDNYGYRYYALGLTDDVSAENTPADFLRGIRSPNNGSLAAGAFPNEAPVIAPMWDDLQLSVFNKYTNQPDDYSKVWYKRSISGDKIVIYYVNLLPIGAKAFPGGGTVTFPTDIRPPYAQNVSPADPYVSCSVQIVLNRLDSTVTFNYENFIGAVNSPATYYRTVTSSAFFRLNSTVGVRGQARHTNYTPTTTVGSAVKYTQSTVYLEQGQNPIVRVAGPSGSENTTPFSGLAIRFKQWKNAVRVYPQGITYKVRDPQTGQFTKTVANSSINNYELLAGDANLGAIQPVFTFQNLTNNIQNPSGVNYQQQQANFRCKFRIKNQIVDDPLQNPPQSLVVFSGSMCIDSTALATAGSGVKLVDAAGTAIPFPGATGMNGVPPYGFVQVTFTPFYSSQYQIEQIGRFTVEVFAEPVICAGGNLGDQWPFDDTTRVTLFVIKNLASFNDDVSDYSVSRTDGAIPSVYKWVSIDAEAVDGEANTFSPPPPRGSFGKYGFNSPVIRLNRLTLGGTEPAAGSPSNSDRSGGGGDQIISFPIDIRQKIGSVLSFSYQRTGLPPGGDPGSGFARGFSDNTLVGPEPRVILNGNCTALQSVPDVLVCEFANPSPDGYTNITNINGTGWNKNPGIHGSAAVTDNPAFTLFGAGGYRIGFFETNKDSALKVAEGLRCNIFDDGKDFEFNKVYIPIPDTIIKSPNDGAKNFRFRLRVVAAKNTSPPQPSDDSDDFFVDNIRISFPTEKTDLELASVSASWPYTLTPASQAKEIPIVAKITNNSKIGAPAFLVKVWIMRKVDADAWKADSVNNPKKYVYIRTQTMPFLPANKKVELGFPNWNGRQTTPGDYIISARLFVPGGDELPANDSTFGTFNLKFGSSFAYDLAQNDTSGTNSVGEQSFSNITGKGIDMPLAKSGGAGAGFGDPFGGTASGEVAMKFTLYTQDTVYGYQAFFAPISQSNETIGFAIHTDNGGVPGATIVKATNVRKERGFDDVRKDYKYDQYTSYLITDASGKPAPVILNPGTYWACVQQLGLSGFELGCSKYRMGMVTTNYGTIPTVGESGTSLVIWKDFRVKNVLGQLINDNYFAYENTLASGTWIPFTPTVGNPALAHLDHTGNVTPTGSLLYTTYSRGSWIPMVRPYFGTRTWSDPPIYVGDVTAVEFVSFDGNVKRNGIELFWETASESNNSGFYVERRNLGDNNWQSVGFVAAEGNSTSAQNYNFLDAKVVRGTTYEYRLRQVDFDGTESFSNTIEKAFNFAEFSVYPNPVEFGSATIQFSVPEKSNVKLEISDLYGNIVRTLENGEMNASENVQSKWDGTDNNGNTLSNGTYLCKLTVGQTSTVSKITLIK